MINPLKAEQLRNVCDPGSFSCRTTRELDKIQTIIGQERAIKALRFGLDIQAKGFNVFVSGKPGTGRTTAAKRFVKDLAKEKEVPNDICYVNNFENQYKPKYLSLPPGKGTEFEEEMEKLIEESMKALKNAFQGEDYSSRKEGVVKKIQKKRNELFEEVEKEAKEKGFALRSTPMGFMTVPLKEDGTPVEDEDIAKLSEKKKKQINKKRQDLQDKLKKTIREARILEKEANKKLEDLDQKIARFTLNPLIEEIKEKYQDMDDVAVFIDEVNKDLVDNLSEFRMLGQSDGGQQQQAMMGGQQPSPSQQKEILFRKYKVNVLVDNSDREGAPVHIELNPTYNNLFGRIEKETQFGNLTTDFTLIREGALHKANGGFLLLPVEDVLMNLFSWDSLKRSLKNQEITVEEASERLGYVTVKSLQPEAVPLNVKVILIGKPMIYQMLYHYDEDFKELFKVKADFDTTIQRKGDSLKEFVSFICTVCDEENLNHLNSTGLSRVVEYASRLADDQKKLSTEFGHIADIIREANYYSRKKKKDIIEDEDIKMAIEEKFYRSTLMKDKIQEYIEENTILIDVEGKKTGQVNGLAVLDLGDASFGKPSKITASISLGKSGLVDIERESNLGGNIHTKGVLILAGYLSDVFARDKPLALAARLVFEQSYSGVDGDSASSTELYAILSALSEVPINQGIAVTGSVNQRGYVQAIGGVNQKIEGFYEVCKQKGLTGEQGVMIPVSNVRNLMLREEVLEAVEDGSFNIWPVTHINEGIEILTGKKAGEKNDDGEFEKDSINYLVNKKLEDMAHKLVKFGKMGKKGDEGSE